MKTRDLNYETRVLVKSIIAVCADSPSKLRPCDIFRLYDMAEEEGVLPYVKGVLKNHNLEALKAWEKYEAEAIEEKYNPSEIKK